MIVINTDSIEEVEDFDGEAAFCFGQDGNSTDWRWEWVPIEALMEAGRTDILQSVGALG